MASGGTLVKTQHFEPPSDAPAYVIDALKDIGIQEWVLDKRRKVSNPVVQQWVAKALHQQTWKGSTITTPWCAYYVNAKLESNGIAGTVSGMARSLLKWGTEVDKQDTTQWKIGDIAIFWRGQYDDHVSGHTTIIIAWDADHIYGIGGNQGDRVCIEAFSYDKLLAVRRVRTVTQSRTVRSAGGAAANEGLLKPAVDAIVPNPTPVQSKGEIISSGLEQIKTPLETLSHYKPWIMGILTALTVGLALYAMYCRVQDHNDGYNS